MLDHRSKETVTPDRRLIGATALFALLAASAAWGQATPLANLIPDLFDRTVVLAETGHQAHFVDSSDALREAGLQLNSSIVGQLSTFPVSSAAGGFTYEFDPELGLFTRSTDSFGPIFAERADTVGKGKISFGLNVSRFEYDTIDDFDLRQGELEFTLTHLDTNHDGTTVETFFEGDLVFANAFLELSSQATVLFANFGVTDRIDLAVAVPFVQVDLEARLETSILRQATEGFSDPPFHIFANGTDSESSSARGSASGIGDVLLRGKYRFVDQEGGALALGLDVRLPTGEEEDLLGTGATQVKALLIGSTSLGRVSPHVNLGYTFSSGGSQLVGELADEINAVFGMDAAVHPRVTLAADVLWRLLLDAQQLERRELPFLFRRHDSTEIEATTRPIVEAETENIDLIDLAVGVKVHVAQRALISANLLYSVTDEGLRDRGLVPLIGVDFSF